MLYEAMTLSGGRVRLCADETIGLSPMNWGWTPRLAAGRSIVAAAVVLAVGNLPSTRPSDGLVFHDPWAAQALAGLRPDEPVLIVGTGLTMVDLALGMRAQGFAGPIIALSRRGLVPQRHGPVVSPVPSPDFDERIRDRGAASAETIDVQRVIHATGIGAGAAQHGLIADLVRAGHVRTDEHGMGLEVTGTLQLVDRDGRAQAGLWALGPIVRAVFWECTAVPDIRNQARLIATELALRLSA